MSETDRKYFASRKFSRSNGTFLCEHNGDKESQANQRFYARSKHIKVQKGFIKIKKYNKLCVCILFQNASSYSCFRLLFHARSFTWDDKLK